MSQPLSAASAQEPAAKAGLPLFPSPSGHSLSIGVFAVRLIGGAAAHFRSSRCGNGHRQPSPAPAGLRQHSFLLLFHHEPCGSVPSLTASSPPASSRCGISRRRLGRPSCGSRHLPSTSHRRFFHEHNPCPFPAHIMLRQAIPASAMTQVFILLLILARRSFAPLPSDFPRGRRTDASFEEQVIPSGLGPWALRGIPLRAGWHEH